MIFLLGIAFTLVEVSSMQTTVYAQQPTVDVPTVTGTPPGASATVYLNLPIVYVYSGPGRDYPEIGILVAGQKVPALAFSRGQEWVQIVYLGVPGGTGWIFSRFVSLSDEEALPVVPAPPTPTLGVSPTLDPTLAAQFLVEIPSTPLPTFTEPAALNVPTFAPESSRMVVGNVPMGFIIIGLVVVGLFGAAISLLRGR